MRMYFCTRVHRRFIIKYFGGLRNFVFWTIAVALTVYVLDALLFGSAEDRTRLNEIVISKQTVSGLVKANVDIPLAADKVVPLAGALGATAPASGASIKAITAPLKITQAVCPNQEACPEGQYSFYIKAGTGIDGVPTICFNGETEISPEKKNGKRGINMVIVNEKTGKIVESRTFDTYEDDSVLKRYFELGLVGNQLIFLATADDASLHLTEETRKVLTGFGSEQITKLAFRDSFVMVGQRGIASPAKASEKLVAKLDTQQFADVSELKGCVSIPMGPLVASSASENTAVGSFSADVEYGADVANCEMSEKCADDTVAVLLSTGKENSEGPKICFNGRLILGSKDKKYALGRGVNVLTVDPATWTAVSFARFDTYETDKDSIALIAYMKAVNVQHVVMMVTHDDAHFSLTADARQTVSEFGSSYFSSIAFRDAWIFVGQANLKVVSAIEEIEFGGTDVWPVPLYKKYCVPRTLKTLDKKQDVEAKKNSPNRVFCRKYDGYEELCSPGHIDDVLTPAPLTDTSMKDNPIFKVPIVVIPGLGHVSTYKQIQALFQIPGIDAALITMMYDQKFQESGALADRFNIPKFQLTSSTKYVFLIEKALEEIWKKFPTADYVILLEEEVIPSKDFLFFFSQSLPGIEKDDSLIGISAWNENGFTNSSGDASLVYRGRTMPGLGVLLKKSFYVQHLAGKMSTCCLKRTWYGWFGEDGSLDGKEMVFPDVSRVMRRPFMGLAENPDLINAYFNRARLTSDGAMVVLADVPTLRSVIEYDDLLNRLVAAGTPVATDNANDCLNGRGLGFSIPDGKSTNAYTIFFTQQDERDGTVLMYLCRCFGLFAVDGYRIRGAHKGTIRFVYKGNAVIFVGSTSPYYKHKPDSLKPVQTVSAI